MNKKTIITTPIYYASGKAHLGHSYTTVLADVFKRYKKLLNNEVFFVTGMDQHGQKISLKAQENNLTEQTFVNNISKDFKALWELLNIDYDDFVCTTNDSHKKAVSKIFSMFLDKGLIYLNNWVGFYCVSCEENYTEKAAKKENNKLYCEIGHVLEKKEEESYFFKMSEFSDWLKEIFNNNVIDIFPSHRKTELINNFINELTDLSITRTTFDWGIQVKENKKHVIYVWLDALFSYLTSLGYLSDEDSNYKKFWENKDSERIHLMSREITRFHCIYWPVFLNSLDLNLPTKILSHGWIITKEGKMSKSLGNVVDPLELINSYGSDSLRYFIAKELPIHKDGVFELEHYIETLNSDLSNNIGNLVSRTIGMLTKYRNKEVPTFITNINKEDKALDNEIDNLLTDFENNVNNFEFNKILSKIINLIKSANKYIEDLKPWELFKNNKDKELDSLLSHLFKIIYITTYLLEPVLVNKTKEIKEQTNINYDINSVYELFDSFDNKKYKVKESKPIFERIKTE